MFPPKPLGICSPEGGCSKGLDAFRFFSNNISLSTDIQDITGRPVAQRYHVIYDTLGREFDPGQRDFSH